ncbi:MAG TPA: hypothetical protein VMF61_14025 [Candidatus Acidoferrales bacterium]|nr:hypothetical protein [Candidatus Acidoferrales bacterium]
MRLVTFLPERPDLNLPRFISFMLRSTFLRDFAPYLRVDFFLREAPLRDDVFFRVDFLRAAVFLREGAFLREVDFFREVDFLRGAI